MSEGEGDVAGELADDGLGAAVGALIEHRVLHRDVGLPEATHLQGPLQRIGVGQRVQRAVPQPPGICCQVINTVLLVHLQQGVASVWGSRDQLMTRPHAADAPATGMKLQISPL